MPALDDLLRAHLLGKKFIGKKNFSLDEKLSLSNNASSILNATIQFVPSTKPYEDESKELKSKYIRIRPSKSVAVGVNGGKTSCSSRPSTSKFSNLLDSNVSKTKSTSNDNGIPPPMFDIYPIDQVQLNWDSKLKRSTAVGLHNLGNTCFLNSVLQVLTNTAPLANYLLSGEHDVGKCPSSTGFCALCLMKNHIQRVFSFGNGNAMSPNPIVSRLRCVMKSHRMGQQEDAHEFLRYFIDSMQMAALHTFKLKKLDLYTKETTVIGRIFGGYHKNEVICNICHFNSTTYDPFLDLSVEVKQSSSLEAALSHFTRAETLANDNAYKCPKCKRRVSARKMFTIHQAPNVLTIQLKRFDHFGKIDRNISYPESLNLRPYMTEKQGLPLNYKLYGVVVHQGRSTRSGHYYAFARNPCDLWHVLDDSRVNTVSPNAALKSSGAYLLFYVRIPRTKKKKKRRDELRQPAAAVVEKPLKTSEVEESVPVIKKSLDSKNGNGHHIGTESKNDETVRLRKKKRKREENGKKNGSVEDTPKKARLISPPPPPPPPPSSAPMPEQVEKKPEKNGLVKGADIVEQLGKQNHFGYGCSVKSWSGSLNCVDQLRADSDDDVDEGNGDEWNEDYDRGKAKKRKKKRGQYMIMGMNPFQSAQNSKNRSDLNRRSAVF